MDILDNSLLCLTGPFFSFRYVGHILSLQCCLTLGFLVKDWTLLTELSLNLLVALHYPICATRGSVFFPTQTLALGRKSSAISSLHTPLDPSYSATHSGPQVHQPCQPYPQGTCSAHPADPDSPANSTLGAFALPTLLPGHLLLPP